MSGRDCVRGLLGIVLATAVVSCADRGNGDSQAACRTATEALVEFDHYREFARYDELDSVVALLSQAGSEPGAAAIAGYLDEIVGFVDATVSDDGELETRPDDIVAMLHWLEGAQAGILAECAEIGVGPDSESAIATSEHREADAGESFGRGLPGVASGNPSSMSSS
jgi:hypothetical protein